jgi:glutamate racemase
MADQRPIGVFDSGVGGLTVLRAIQAQLPGEATVYLGDTARVPYGTRSAETVIRYAINNARTLVAKADVKALVVACNTVSAVAMDALRHAVTVPVLGVIEPGARAALSATKGGTIVVLGTAGTVRSGAYPRAVGHAGKVFARACPLLVPLVEEGWTDGEVPRLVVKEYLSDLPIDTDTVVLGCTHYPLLRGVLRRALPDKIALVDGAEATAQELSTLLRERGIERSDPTAPQHRLLVTDAPDQLVKLAPAFLGAQVSKDAVELVDVLMTA